MTAIHSKTVEKLSQPARTRPFTLANKVPCKAVALLAQLHAAALQYVVTVPLSVNTPTTSRRARRRRPPELPGLALLGKGLPPWKL